VESIPDGSQRGGGDAADMPSSHTSLLDRVHVGDCMHHGIFTCDAETPLGEVAAIMSARRVHALAIAERAGHPPAIVCDLDVVAAAAASDRFTAADMAASEPLTISSDSTLRQAAQLMAEHEVTHLIVSDAVDGHPAGVLSTTDLLSVFALGEKDPM